MQKEPFEKNDPQVSNAWERGRAKAAGCCVPSKKQLPARRNKVGGAAGSSYKEIVQGGRRWQADADRGGQVDLLDNTTDPAIAAEGFWTADKPRPVADRVEW